VDNVENVENKNNLQNVMQGEKTFEEDVSFSQNMFAHLEHKQENVKKEPKPITRKFSDKMNIYINKKLSSDLQAAVLDQSFESVSNYGSEASNEQDGGYAKKSAELKITT
jgi:hypothetical protein